MLEQWQKDLIKNLQDEEFAERYFDIAGEDSRNLIKDLEAKVKRLEGAYEKACTDAELYIGKINTKPPAEASVASLAKALGAEAVLHIMMRELSIAFASEARYNKHLDEAKWTAEDILKRY